MPDPTAMDPQVLHAAAGRLDVLFDESGTALRETDQSIAGSADGWKAEAATAFGRFNGYLDDRRSLLQTNIAEMAELMRTTADSLQAEDQSTSQGLLGQAAAAPGSTSLNL